MKKITWEEFLSRDWVGCDTESHEGDMVYRGPIREIEHDATTVVFRFKWGAKCKPLGPWSVHDQNVMFADKEGSTLQDIGDGRVMLTMPMIGMSIFYPKTVSRLNPAKVEGLPPEFLEPDFVDPKD